MEQSEVQAMLQGIREARAAGEPVALATIVGVTGSAYRREGTRMLVRQDGSYTCMLSGGCLEPEIVEVAQQVMRDGQPVRTEYNLDEEVMWGLGIGCGGAVDVYIEPVQDEPVTNRWLEALERGELAVLATPLEPGLGRLFVGETASAGALADAGLEALARAWAHQLLKALQPRAATHALRASDGRTVPVFFDVSLPPAELVIFGAGHDAIPLSRLAAQLGLRVQVVDMRDKFALPSRFPGARVRLLRPEHFAQALEVGPRTFVLVMNHNLLVDQSTLAFVLQTPAPYVGLLGPRSRFLKIVEGLAREGTPLTPEQLRRVRSPVGLAIGAETPEEVALSILAEIMALQRGYPAGFLNGLEGRIHDPTEAPVV
ncbi:XdhC family protein [Calidithermus chliarophilus]|uniref:XdhC family protein n=1 Tax=Calidithermus chliarophilus TaxID=52023 RepID=UPI000481A2B0|nr:XdhC/CoxI family protein [Calidithermus chliarophilus]